MGERIFHFLTDPQYAELYFWMTSFLRWYIFTTLLVGLVTMILKRPRTLAQWAAFFLLLGFLCVMIQVVIFIFTGIMLNSTFVGVFFSLMAAIGCTLFLIACLVELGILARDGYRLWRASHRR